MNRMCHGCMDEFDPCSLTDDGHCGNCVEIEEAETTIRKSRKILIESISTPTTPKVPGNVTYEDVKAFPWYYIVGPGREAAEASSCSHGYRMTDSCPCCE